MNQESGNHESGKQVPSDSGKVVLLLLGLLVGLWGVLGWMDIRFQSTNGVTLDRTFTVTAIEPDTPAAQTSLEIGDKITHIDRIPVEDSAELARLDRVDIGFRRTFWVTKFDKELGEVADLEFNIRHIPIDNHTRSKERVRIIVGFCFLLMPLVAWFLTPNAATRILVMVGAGLGLSFMGGPHISGYDVRALFAAVEGVFVYVGLAAMLQFLLVFPHQRPFLSRPSAKKIIYLPVLALWLLLAWKLYFPPGAGSAGGVVINLGTGLIMGGYMLISLILLLRNFARTSRDERKALGVNTMLIGSLVALLPVLVGNIVSAVADGTPLPGQEYYFVFLVLIPMTWSLAARKIG